jgi:hypothetical protein
MNFLDKIDDSNNILFILFIFTLILLLLYYFLKNAREHGVTEKKNDDKKLVEGLNLRRVKKIGNPVKSPIPDIGKIVKDVQNVGNVANKLGKEVTNLGKSVSKGINQMEKATTKAVDQIDRKLANFEKVVIRKANDLVIEKIEKLFTGLGNVLNDGIIRPLTTLFTGLGSVFMQIFEILKKMGYKIVSLPGCILFYLINGTVSSILGFISWFIPSWIENPIAGIWNATFGKLLDWFLGLIGYTAASKKCYGFNVDEEIDNMNTSFKKIGDSFSKDFGRLNFNTIKI